MQIHWPVLQRSLSLIKSVIITLSSFGGVYTSDTWDQTCLWHREELRRSWSSFVWLFIEDLGSNITIPNFACSSRKKILERFLHSSDQTMAWEREAVQEVLGYFSLPQAFHRAWESMPDKGLLHTTVRRTMIIISPWGDALCSPTRTSEQPEDWCLQGRMRSNRTESLGEKYRFMEIP